MPSMLSRASAACIGMRMVVAVTAAAAAPPKPNLFFFLVDGEARRLSLARRTHDQLTAISSCKS
eukprot:SAG22_NODE_114_length_19318_cov_13.809980_10_plen_64_part_00